MRALPLPLVLVAPLLAQDADGDGLSDFHELHKYRTDPASADSDGDGVPDGEWFERREFAYTVRSVVHVMPPVTDDVLCDDYQDARVLDRGPQHVELEVIHYPYSTAGTEIPADPDWRRTAAGMTDDLRPGPSSNWDAEMRDALVAGLAEDGVDVATLDDVTLVKQAAAWALRRARHTDLFTTFCAEVGEGGAVRVHPDLAEHVAAEARNEGLTVEEAMQRELFAKGMFEHGTRGSCTSSAIYLNGVLRALGVPTRVILTIPVIDASDERELGFVDRLQNPEVRAIVRRGVSHLGRSWASHTYNEVFVGGRWRRLNYTRLGQPTLDQDYFGLMTHVATVPDWLEGGFAATIGRRQELRRGADDVFGGWNPYSCISLSDRYGVHSGLAPPEPAPEVRTVKAVFWADDPALPEFIHGKLDPGRVLLETAEDEAWRELKDFLAYVDPVLLLEAEGHPTLTLTHGTGGMSTPARRFVIATVAGGEPVEGVTYALVPRDREVLHRWVIADGVVLAR